MARAAIRLVISVVVVLGTTTPLSFASTVCTADQYVESFKVRAKPRRNEYKVGQKAVIALRVTDSTTGMPQQGVDAGVLIEGKRNHAIIDSATTNQDGRAVVRLRLRRAAVKPGWARAWAAAWDPVNTPAYCTGRYGDRKYPRFFRIRA